MHIAGGEFTTCQSEENGAFAFASAGAVLNITGGLVTNNTATKRAGVVSQGGYLRIKSWLLKGVWCTAEISNM